MWINVALDGILPYLGWWSQFIQIENFWNLKFFEFSLSMIYFPCSTFASLTFHFSRKHIFLTYNKLDFVWELRKSFDINM